MRRHGNRPFARHSIGATRCLTKSEQTAFAGLAVFSGGCTLQAAEAVLGIDLGAVEALLAKSLLVTHTQNGGVPRVRMLEPVRGYAAERFMERRDVEDVRRSHCEYYVRLAELSEPELRGEDQMSWLHRAQRRPRQPPGSRELVAPREAA